MSLDIAKKAFNKIKIRLMEDHNLVFFTTVCFSLQHIWTKDIPTAGTDGKRLLINPDFFMSLNKDEQLFLILHETLHVAFSHTVRVSTRDKKKWNIAADYVINAFLINNSYKMPVGGLYDPQYNDMSTDQVYDLLPEDPVQKCEMDILEGEGSAEKQKQDLDDILVRAGIQQKMSQKSAGNLPKEIEIYLEELTDPKLPWYRILRSFFNKMAKTDYTFRKPNRRYFPDHILPSQYGEVMGDIAVAIDTSGSVTQGEFNNFISEVRAIMKQLRPKETTLLQFDTEIKAINALKTETDLKTVSFTGRGGTYIPPVIAWAKEKKPYAMVIFTDGYFRHEEEDPGVPVIWIIHSNPEFTAPYGKVIHYEFAGK